uniref:PARP catalytic domain-containing protein n=1 Tax=Pygocentrus nattereri TaxID=42514 RepID=A0A3B4EM33_PYGNA
EAKAWATRILHKPEDITINNNHVIRFGQEDHEKLMSIQTKFNVLITEFFRNGKCGITINGERTDVSSAALEVEAMLLKAQEDFANAEENELLRSVVCWQAFPGSEEPEINAALEKTYLTGVDSKRKLQKSGLKIVKVEKMENNALKQVFELNEKRVLKFQQLYQCVTAQFCELICRVGFQREYAPPEEQKYGAGIYFTTEVETALKLWKDYEEEYIYIIEARVLTGQSTAGSPQFIVPPPTKDDPLVLYDSVTDANKDIFVIFNGQQALPEFLITFRICLTLSKSKFPWSGRRLIS